MERQESFLFFFNHTSSSPVTVQRREKDGSLRNVECPPLLPDYQAYMRGIDRADQLMGYYNVGRRSKKWWKRVFAYLLEVSILNAYVLQKFKTGETEKDFLSFRLALATQLVGTYRRSHSGRPRSLEHKQLLRLDTTRSHLPECVASKRDCVVCSKMRNKLGISRKEYRHESCIKRIVCDVHLCLNKERNCYKIYHTEVEY